jgi:PAS domain S-box-containing protein
VDRGRTHESLIEQGAAAGSASLRLQEPLGGSGGKSPLPDTEAAVVANLRPNNYRGAGMRSIGGAKWSVPLGPFATVRSLRPARIALAAGLCFTVLVLAFAALLLWYERAEELRYAQRDTSNLSHTLSEHLGQTLDTIDLGLKAALSQLHDLHGSGADGGVNGRILRAHANALASVSAVGLYGPQGEQLAASTAEHGRLPQSLAGTESLALHASGKAIGMHVSAPLRIGRDGGWHLLLTRAIVGPAGHFRGVVAALFDLRSFADAYRSIDIGPHGSLALLGWNGALLAAYPWREDLIGKPFIEMTYLLEPGPEEFADLRTRRSPFDGRAVIAANTPLRGYPLILSLMVDEHAVLAPWRRQAMIEGIAALLIGALALSLAAVLDRHLRRREESVAQLRDNQAELTEAQRIARLGSWRIDGRSGMVEWSEQAAALLGVPAGSISTLEQLLGIVLEEDRPRVQHAWTELGSGGSLDVEFRALRSPGEERWLRARAEAPSAADRSPYRARGTLIDVTDERRAEQAAQHLAAVVESTEDAIFSASADGRILSWNRGATRMFGLRPEQTIGRRLSELLPANEAAEAARLVARAASGESIEAFETALNLPGERRIYISVTLSPLRNANGLVTAASAVARDIRARRESERRRLFEHRIAQLLAESAPLTSTMPRILDALCRSLGLDCGVQWELDERSDLFRRSCLWVRPGWDPQAFAASFEPTRSSTDDGYLAAAWRTAVPRWVDLARFAPWRGGANDAPFVSSLLIPITLGARVIAMLELLGVQTQPHEGELLSSAEAIGSQIGQYMERRRAEDALRAEKEYIAHVFASAPTLIASIAADGTTRSVNPSIRDITGFTPEDLQGRNFWLTLCGHDAAARVEQLLNAAAHGGVADYHIAIRTRRGELRDLAVSAAARRAAGSVVEYVLVGTDVTARRLDEARRSTEYAVARALTDEQSEQEAIERILCTICSVLGWECGVYRVFDPGTRLVSCPYVWSKQHAALQAVTQELRTPKLLRANTMYWRTVESRYPQWDNDVPARVSGALRSRLLDAGLRSAISIPVQAGERFLGALQFFGRSNQRPEDVLIEAMQAIGQQVGQFIERKRVEAERQQADERLRSIAANIPGIVFEYRLRPDHTAAFEFVSERALDMLEESPQTLMRDPRTMFRLVEPGYRRQLLRSMRISRHSRSLWIAEMPVRLKSGRVRWVRGQSMPKYLDDGTVIWDGVIVDVTAQKQAEQAIQQMNEQLERRVTERTAQLSAANRELESFAYSVSHDLRAPLRSIDGFSRILVEEYAQGLQSTAYDYLVRVRKASERMGQLIDDLLSLSRVTRSELKRVRTDLSAIAESVVQELRAEYPERVVHVSIHPGMHCLADPSLMRIAMQNLLGNAWKFTSKQPTASIEFGALSQRNKMVYYVRDDGAGFDMAHAGKLFGAFQRLHSPREFEGTGVGLATVSRVIDRHGGTVWAESSLGKGATFYFTLAAGASR